MPTWRRVHELHEPACARGAAPVVNRVNAVRRALFGFRISLPGVPQRRPQTMRVSLLLLFGALLLCRGEHRGHRRVGMLPPCGAGARGCQPPACRRRLPPPLPLMLPAHHFAAPFVPPLPVPTPCCTLLLTLLPGATPAPAGGSGAATASCTADPEDAEPVTGCKRCSKGGSKCEECSAGFGLTSASACVKW